MNKDNRKEFTVEELKIKKKKLERTYDIIFKVTLSYMIVTGILLILVCCIFDCIFDSNAIVFNVCLLLSIFPPLTVGILWALYFDEKEYTIECNIKKNVIENSIKHKSDILEECKLSDEFQREVLDCIIKNAWVESAENQYKIGIKLINNETFYFNSGEDICSKIHIR